MPLVPGSSPHLALVLRGPRLALPKTCICISCRVLPPCPSLAPGRRGHLSSPAPFPPEPTGSVAGASGVSVRTSGKGTHQQVSTAREGQTDTSGTHRPFPGAVRGQDTCLSRSHCERKPTAGPGQCRNQCPAMSGCTLQRGPAETGVSW